MLPTLSLLSVSNGPETCLRHWCSSRYLHIPPLHREFQSPLPHSSPPVPGANPPLSSELSHQTRRTAYEPFTPNNSGQRLHPTYYRGCWHVVSRCLFERYTHKKLAPQQKRFTTRRPSSRTRRRCIRLSPIVQYSPLLPPVGVWAVSQSQCGRSPSQAGYPSKPWQAVTPPTS